MDFGRSYFYLTADPVEGLKSTITAFKTYPYDWEIRQQVYLSLRNLTLYRDVVMDRATERWAWDVSASASPFSPLLHAAKIEVPE